MSLFALLIYLTGTYFPLIYTFAPFLGKLKIVLLAGVFLLVSLIVNHRQYTNHTAYRNPIVYCWAVFLCLMMLGIFGSFDRGRTLEIIELNFKYFLVFLVMIKIVDTPKKLEAVLLTFTLCGVGMAMSAIYNYIFNVEVLVGSEALTGGYRAIALEGGLFGDPNDLALLLITALPFAGYYLLVKEKKILPLLGVLVIATGVMLTHSRAGFLGLCVTGLAFLYFFGKTQKKYVILFLGLAILFWSFAPESYKERIGSITAWEKDERTGMTGTRMDSWMVALAEGLKNPVLGVGAGSGVYVMGQTSRDWHDIHNTFVQVFLEIGGFGFIAYLLLFVIPLKQRKLFIGNMDESFLKLDILYKAMIISFISFSATAFFTPQAYSPLLYTLTGFSIIALELMRKQTSSLSLRKTEVPDYRSRTRELQGARL